MLLAEIPLILRGKDSLGVPFTFKLFSVPSVFSAVSSVVQGGGGGDYSRSPNLASLKNPMSSRDRPSFTRFAITSPTTLQNL